jgi:hypothetical protein
MQRTFRCALLLAAFALPGAAAAEAWDHRAMQSHHVAVDRSPPALAPGEVRHGRIVIGAPASASDQLPATLPRASQRPWQQRNSFAGAKQGAAHSNAPRIRAGRSDGTAGR